MSNQSFIAACIQMNSGTDVRQNVVDATRLIREAATAGAHYVQTPEMTTIVEQNRMALEAAIHPQDGNPSIAEFSALAQELKIWLHIGSLAIAVEGEKTGPAIANRAVLFRSDGTLAAQYDKIHMFDVDLDNGESWRESKAYRPGGKAVLTDIYPNSAPAKLGFAICYDVRFPPLFKSYAQQGADILCAPAAFTRQTGEAHWGVLQRARAIENGAFMISAAQVGRHEDGRETYGHSIVVDPWGTVLAEA
ncbi:MAG: carbon-nitrogen hydrolase family protein, partial [Hyphomicrobiales bacterium]